MKNRTGIDFSKHVHTTDIYKCGDKVIQVDHFKIPGTRMNAIEFINTDEILSVTGDFGNWIFCRPFTPSANGSVSDGYWLEKLRTASCQVPGTFDSEEITKEIQEKIETGLEEYGYHGEKLKQAKEWFKELLSETDDELDYTHKAYRDYHKPNFIEYDEIPFCKKVNNWLLIIFDAFEEMCLRMKNNEKG